MTDNNTPFDLTDFAGGLTIPQSTEKPASPHSAAPETNSAERERRPARKRVRKIARKPARMPLPPIPSQHVNAATPSLSPSAPLPSAAEIRKQKAARAKRKKSRGTDYIQSTIIFDPELYTAFNNWCADVRRECGVTISRSMLVRGMIRIFLTAVSEGFTMTLDDLFQPDPNNPTEMAVFQHAIDEKLRTVFHEYLDRQARGLTLDDTTKRVG